MKPFVMFMILKCKTMYEVSRWDVARGYLRGTAYTVSLFAALILYKSINTTRENQTKPCSCWRMG